MNPNNAIVQKAAVIKNNLVNSSLGITIRRNSPKILFVAGTGAIVTGTVLACCATAKLPDIIEERNNKLDEVKNSDELDEKEINRQITKIHAATALQIGTAYAPAAISEVVGFVCLGKAQGDVTKKYLKMSAAYAGLQTTFTAYRNGVKKRFGEEVDREILYGIYEQKVKRINENGEEIEETKKVADLSKYGSVSAFSTVIFDERSSFFEKNQQMNANLISIVVHGANEKLIARGQNRKDNLGKVLFLNEILDMLDLPRTPYGNILGWRYDPNNRNKITYDIFWGHKLDESSMVYSAFEDDADDARAWIRFNVDGNVLDDLNENA